MIVHRSALVDQPATHLFDLIEAVEHYPAFLPWCTSASVVCRDDAVVSADVGVRYCGAGFDFRTRNAKRRPEHMSIQLERGPFRRFEGEWRLSALTPTACKVDFTLDWEFDSELMTLASEPLFGRMANALVDAFVVRSASTPVAINGSASKAAPGPAGDVPTAAVAALRSRQDSLSQALTVPIDAGGVST